MIQLFFIQPDGAIQYVRAVNGQTLLSAARESGIDGFTGECGGNGTCGTCHCYIETEHLAEMFAHLVTPAHEAVAATLRTVVRGLCAELAPGIRNVREGTHDNASLRLHAAQSRVSVPACRRASYEDGVG